MLVIAMAASAGCAAQSSATPSSAAPPSQALPSSLPTASPTPVPTLSPVVCDAARAVLKIVDTPLAQLSAGLAESRKLISVQDGAILALPEFERPLLRDISRVRDALDAIASGNTDVATAYLADARVDVEGHYQLSCQLPT